MSQVDIHDKFEIGASPSGALIRIACLHSASSGSLGHENDKGENPAQLQLVALVATIKPCKTTS